MYQGIIGADPVNPFNISGVAFDASISAYRIFGCLGFTTDDGRSCASLIDTNPLTSGRHLVIVDGLLMGVKEGQDILTMSLGGADGWTESTSSVVSSRIAGTGKIVTIAAGNDVRAIFPSFVVLSEFPAGCIWSVVHIFTGERHQRHLCCKFGQVSPGTGLPIATLIVVQHCRPPSKCDCSWSSTRPNHLL